MQDVKEYAKALYRALKEDPFYKNVEQSVENADHARAAMQAYYVLSMRDAERWGRLTLSEGGALGAAVWSVPLEPEASALRHAERSKALRAALGERGADFYAKISQSISACEAELNLTGFWYLSILGVDPAHQGRRMGADLLRPVLAEADEAGANSYLTTFSPGNIRFYESIGFTRAGVYREPETDSTFTVLVRSAGARG